MDLPAKGLRVLVTVVGFTQSLAAEAGPDGVRVNCIQPGIVEGERVERIMAAKAEQLGVSKEEVRNRMVEGVALCRKIRGQSPNSGDA